MSATCKQTNQQLSGNRKCRVLVFATAILLINFNSNCKQTNDSQKICAGGSVPSQPTRTQFLSLEMPALAWLAERSKRN